MSRIDYSKWDRLEVSSSDEDQESDEECEGETRGSGHTLSSRHHAHTAGKPQVTTLTHPSRVTVGPDGVQVEAALPLATASPFRSPPQTTTTTTPGTTPPPNGAAVATDVRSVTGLQSTGGSEKQSARVVETAPCEEADVEENALYNALTHNGGREGDDHLWAQSNDTVTISFIVPMATKAKDVIAFRVFAKEPGTSPVDRPLIVFDLAPPPLRAEKGLTATRHVEKELCYPVKLQEDVLDGCWQLQTLPSRGLRLLVVQLSKENVVYGATLWWDRCCTTDTLSTINTLTIADRKDLPKEAAEAEARRNVWKEANDRFRQRHAAMARTLAENLEDGSSEDEEDR